MADENNDKKIQNSMSITAADLESKEDRKAEVIDINTLQIKVLIVSQNVSVMENVVYYLNRRGWQAEVVGTVRDAFLVIGDFKPDFVLFSVNLKGARVSQIPTLIHQTLKIDVITFGENQSPLTQKKLQEINSQHSIVGMASGPGVHRKIKNILLEISTSANEEAKQVLIRAQERKILSASADPIDGVHQQKRGYTFSIEENGNEESKSDRIRRQFAEADKINSLKENASLGRTRDINEEEENYGTVKKRFSNDKKKIGQINKYLDSENDENDENEEEDQAGYSAEYSDEDERSTEDEYAEEAEQSDEDEESLEELIALAKKSREGVEDIGTITTRTHAITTSRQDLNQLKIQSPGDVKITSSTGQSFSLRQSVEKASLASDIEEIVSRAKEAADANIHIKENPLEMLGHFIIQSARKAAEAVKPPTQVLSQATKCTVWPVSCTQLSGFIVVSHGGSLKEEQEFNDRFIEFVRGAGLEVCSTFQVDEYLITDLEQVDLKQHVEGEKFTATVSSGKSEIIIKLIEGIQVNPKVSMSASLDKAQIDVTDLVPELAPGADLFLYLPKNDRYFMYLKVNGVLSSKQKHKLSDTNAKLFINSQDIDKYTKAFVKNRTVQKIRDLKEKKKKAS